MITMQYEYLLNLIKDDPTNAINEYSKKYNIPQEIVKVEIIYYKELRRLLFKHIPKEEQKSLLDISEVTDISDVKIVEIFEDDHLPCTIIVFQDQNHHLRRTMIGWDNDIPGMVRYYKESIKIKNDLIKMINLTYEYEREDRKENKAINK